jgi:hypothetical protein
MALAITVPAQVEVGDIIKVTGAGGTATGNMSVKVYSEESGGGLEATAVLVAAGGAFDTTGKFDFRANEEGHVDIAVTDVTAALTQTARVQVNRSN